MALDVAELGLRVVDMGAEKGAQSLARLSSEAKKAEQAERSLNTTTTALSGTVRAQAQAYTQSSNALGLYARSQAQAAASTTAAGVAAAKGAIDLARLREPLTALSSMALGVTGPFGQIVSLLGSMTLAAPLLAAALIGAGGIGFAYKALTKDARELEKAAREAHSEVSKMRLGETGALSNRRGVLDAQLNVVQGRIAANEGTTRFVLLEQLRAKEKELLADIRDTTTQINAVNAQALTQHKADLEARAKATHDALQAEAAEWRVFFREMRDQQTRMAPILKTELNGALEFVVVGVGDRLQRLREFNTEFRLIGEENVRDARRWADEMKRIAPIAMPTGTIIRNVSPILTQQPAAGGGIDWRSVLQMLGSSAAGYAGSRGGVAGGALSGALTGALSGNPAAAAAGAFVGLTSALLGSAEAAKRVREQFETAMKGIAQSTQNFANGALRLNSFESRRMAAEDFAKQSSQNVWEVWKSGPRDRASVDAANAQLNAIQRALNENLKRIAEDFERFQSSIREDAQIRTLIAQGDMARAQILRDEAELSRLREEGANEATIAAVRFAQAAESAARAAAEAARAAETAQQHARDFADLEVRRFAAQGYSQYADDLAFKLKQKREYEDAVKGGYSAEYLAEVLSVQQLEAWARQQAIADAAQLAATEASADRFAGAVADQSELLQAQLRVAQEQLRAQEQAIEMSQRVVETLRRYSDSLVLNPRLTILSPLRQMMEARSQFDALLGKARGGDKEAAMGLPGAGTSLLEASRGYNASGQGYIADFLRVQQVIADVTSQYGAQLTTEQQILAELIKQTAAMQRELDAINAASSQASADANATREALKPVIVVDRWPERPIVPRGPEGGGFTELARKMDEVIARLGMLEVLPAGFTEVSDKLDEVVVEIQDNTRKTRMVAV